MNLLQKHITRAGAFSTKMETKNRNKIKSATITTEAHSRKKHTIYSNAYEHNIQSLYWITKYDAIHYKFPFQCLIFSHQVPEVYHNFYGNMCAFVFLHRFIIFSNIFAAYSTFLLFILVYL